MEGGACWWPGLKRGCGASCHAPVLSGFLVCPDGDCVALSPHVEPRRLGRVLLCDGHGSCFLRSWQPGAGLGPEAAGSLPPRGSRLCPGNFRNAWLSRACVPRTTRARSRTHVKERNARGTPTCSGVPAKLQVHGRLLSGVPEGSSGRLSPRLLPLCCYLGTEAGPGPSRGQERVPLELVPSVRFRLRAESPEQVHSVCGPSACQVPGPLGCFSLSKQWIVQEGDEAGIQRSAV